MKRPWPRRRPAAGRRLNLEILNGHIERLTYQNEETGFTVAKVAVSGRAGLVTAVGRMIRPLPGELVELKGHWENHPSYGPRFQIEAYETKAPASSAGLKKYLASGLVKGIGPVLAERIVDKFGPETLEILEAKPHRLTEVEGLGRKKREAIIEAWREGLELRRLMIFLEEFGLGPAAAARVARRLGPEAERLVRENPYRLSYEVEGIGFLTADKVAASLGLARAHPRRVEAGLLYVLTKKAEEGHCFCPTDELFNQAREFLEVDPEALSQALARLILNDQVRPEHQDEPGRENIFLAPLYRAETKAAQRLDILLKTPARVQVPRPEKALAWAESQLGLALAPGQKEAVLAALTEKALLITGGPGTGKTTITRAITTIYGALTNRLALASPTGRAAKRLSQATGRPAKTLHRLLEFTPGGGFSRGPKNPLKADLVLVDETSMLDIYLLGQLLGATPPEAGLILVGDRDQLPSVGPGNVLGDLIDSGRLKVAELKDIFRQTRQSRIVLAAHQINRGRRPESSPGPDGDFYFLEENEPERVLEKIVHLLTRRLPDKLGLDPIRDMVVLTPMHKGLLGSANLNAVLGGALNHRPGPGLVQAERTFRAGDKVIQLKNNYEQGVFNGDLGLVAEVDPGPGELKVDYDGRLVTYNHRELMDLSLAYALTIHKSQGSEFPVVIVPLTTQHFIMLRRNLVYTAVTRGRRFVVLVGSAKALDLAVGNDQETRRHTALARRLRLLAPN